MSTSNFVDKEFKGLDYTTEILVKGEYENCIFNNCKFSNSDLSNINFLDCEFRNCDLSTANVLNTAFRAVKFINCKLLGLHFENCNHFLFNVDFKGSQLNLSSFYQLNLKQTKFIDCSLHEVDFTEADLTESTFENYDLIRAMFENTILQKADIRTSFNFSIDPELNQMKKAKFSKENLSGLLGKYNIDIE